VSAGFPGQLRGVMRTRKCRISIVTLVVFVVLATASGVLAHRLYKGWMDVWHKDQKCLDGKVTQDHGPTDWGKFPNGVWATQSTSTKPKGSPWGPIACSAEWDRVAGKHRVRTYVLKYHAATKEWGVCIDIGWRKSRFKTDGWQSVIFSGPKKPPCGAGHYTMIGKAQHRFKGHWRGGGITLPGSEEIK
jgi:hypothetical protein